MIMSHAQLAAVNHEGPMRRAIALAASARENGNKPFGALLADFNGVILLEAENSEFSDNDFTRHAEVNLLSLASRTYSVEELRGTILYASCEPCAMCAAAAFFTGVPNVVYGLSANGLASLWQSENPNPRVLDMSCRQVFETSEVHPTQVVGPIMSEAAAEPHIGYRIPWK